MVKALSSNFDLRAVLTALGNDYNYDDVFMKQVVAFGKSGDVLFSISTSGNSANCVKASECANELGITTVALTGRKGGKLKEICSYTFNVDSDETPRVQESHIMIIHLICGIIEEKLASAGFFEE